MSRHHPANPVELYREADAFTVIVDLARFDRDDVDVTWQGGRLHVSAERPTADGRVRTVDREVGLPHPIEEWAVTASFEDGLLEVRLPISEGTRDRMDVPVA